MSNTNSESGRTHGGGGRSFQKEYVVNGAELYCPYGGGKSNIHITIGHGLQDNRVDAVLEYDTQFASFQTCCAIGSNKKGCHPKIVGGKWQNADMTVTVNGHGKVHTGSYMLCNAYDSVGKIEAADMQRPSEKEHKGKLVFFIHGLGASWTEFDTMVSGTIVDHNELNGALNKEKEALKGGLKNEVDGLAKTLPFIDAGVISQRRPSDPDIYNLEDAQKMDPNSGESRDKTAVHNCISFDFYTRLSENKIPDLLQEDKIVCIKVEFSSGTETFAQQCAEMDKIVNAAENKIREEGDLDFIYDVAFVGHSMGGIAAINYGVTYAQNHSNVYVDIITVSTPYYANGFALAEVVSRNYDWQKLNQPITFLMKRGQNGAQLSLAGLTGEFEQLKNKWNQHILSTAGQRTKLGSIAVNAQGNYMDESGQFFDGDLIVPFEVQLGNKRLDPRVATLGTKEIQSFIYLYQEPEVKFYKNCWETVQGHSDLMLQWESFGLKTASEIQEEFDQLFLKEVGTKKWNDYINSPESMFQNEIDKILSIAVQGESLFYSDLTNYRIEIQSYKNQYIAASDLASSNTAYETFQRVQPLLAVFGSQKYLTALNLGNAFHHVNTPDLPPIIETVGKYLKNGVPNYTGAKPAYAYYSDINEIEEALHMYEENRLLQYNRWYYDAAQNTSNAIQGYDSPENYEKKIKKLFSEGRTGSQWMAYIQNRNFEPFDEITLFDIINLYKDLWMECPSSETWTWK